MAYGITQSPLLVAATPSYFSTGTSITALDITGDITVEAWVKFTSMPSDRATIVGKANSAGSAYGSYHLELEKSGANYNLRAVASLSGTPTQIVSKASWNPSTGVWYHIAYTRIASTGASEIIIDGVSAATATTAGTVDSATSGLYIGRFGSGTSLPLDGRVSLVRVWNAQLSAATINANKCKVYGGATSYLQGEWSLDNVLTDASVNASTLTNTGSVVFATDSPSTCAITGNTAKILVVAGGGGGGGTGAGGAGGVLYDSTFPVSAQAYTVTIGAGGAGGSSDGTTKGSNGSNSVFSTMTAIGGGGGGIDNEEAGDANGPQVGGGGGAMGRSSTAGKETGAAGTAGQGYAGGNTVNTSPYPSGGGGGAGGAGSNGAASAHGNGGAGIADASVGGLLTDASAGSGGYIAGGGGGGGVGGAAAGAAGTGGGGAGSTTTTGGAGTANTGGGGGGGAPATGGGGAGGSGLVIAEYTTSQFTHTGGNATGTAGSLTWVKFTSSGTLTLTAVTAPLGDNFQMGANF